MSVTLKEIAKIANVNISTVSRALNDSPLITQETKDKILAIAQEMNYFPNSLARGLVSHKSETLGLILPKIFFLQGPFFSEVLRGIEQVSVENGYNILIASDTGKDRDKNFPFNLTRAKRIDGMLIINEQQRISNLIALKKERFPFVFINRYIKDQDINCVASNNVQGGKIATEHLIEKGHKRIGIITGSFEMAASHERFEGYRNALKEKELVFDKSLMQEGMFEQGIETGTDCAMKLLEHEEPPTAIFAFSDEIAIGAMQAVKNKGLKIPDDIAIIGYDNIEYSAHLTPPLTTISQDPFTIGYESCQMLIDELCDRKPAKNHLQIPVKLVVRDSCGTE